MRQVRYNVCEDKRFDIGVYRWGDSYTGMIMFTELYTTVNQIGASWMYDRFIEDIKLRLLDYK